MRGFKRLVLVGVLAGAGLAVAGSDTGDQGGPERTEVGEARGAEQREGRANDSQDLSTFQGQGGSGMEAAPVDGGTGGSGMMEASPADAGTPGGK